MLRFLAPTLRLIAMLVALGAFGPAFAQSGPTPVQVGPGGLINPQRDCKTVRFCNFARTGSYRGCVSAYSCRACRFVAARCDIDGTRRTCSRVQCAWG
ncbi:MAG: hypothetical protein ACOYLQ_03005 [Hyphomicrobiaceae bacterium]